MGSATYDSSALVLFGSTRRDVLALLYGDPDTRFFFREILRTVGGGSGALQRELRALTEAGLLERTEEGKQVYYAANRHSPIFQELRAIVEKTTGAAATLRRALATHADNGGIHSAFIHGSMATGEAAAASDVDVMVIGSVTLAELVPSLRAAEARLGREVNVSLYPPPEFQAKLERGNAFLSRVMAEPRTFVVGDQRELDRVAR